MSRLTERDGYSYTYSEYATTRNGSCCFGVAHLRNEAIDKLGRLEDIEEEHGIEITTLSKLLKQGFVYIRDGASIERNQGFIIDNTGLWSQVRLDPKKYGKKAPGGWALTKEELQ